MGFSEKIQKFFNDKNLTNRDVSKIMEGYSESMISKYINSDNISITFIEKVAKYFPDADLNYLIKDDLPPVVEDFREEYRKGNLILIEEIESRLALLKSNLTR